MMCAYFSQRDLKIWMFLVNLSIHKFLISSEILGGSVNTYSAPVNGLDSLAGPSLSVAEDRDGAGGHHHHDHGHHSSHGATASVAAPADSYQVKN